MNMTHIAQCLLFANIDAHQFTTIVECLTATEHIYQKDECIFLTGDKVHSVGVVLSGGVHVLQEDFWGRRMILSHAEPGGVFGAAFSCVQQETLSYTVEASEDSEILLLNLQKLMTSCTPSCTFRTLLTMNLVQLLSQKYVQLTQKVTHLSQKNIRNKLLSFLSSEALRTGTSKVDLYFNRQELADYLYVDRSALSRELAAMQAEGLLHYEKNYFELLRP